MPWRLDPSNPNGISQAPKDGYSPYFAGGPGKPSLLDSVNGKHGAVQITAGSNVTVDNSGTGIVISSTGGGGGGGSGTVTEVSSTSGDATVANGTTTPAITIVSAPKLTTARNINGVAFDGTANITVADATKEPIITAGTSAQYYRGDKTMQTLNAAAVPDFSTATDARIAAAAGVSVASLSGGKVPSSQLPAVGLVTVQTAASQAAQLALTTQEGDVVVRTDTSVTYMRNAGTAGTMADFTLLNTPSDAVTSVNGQTGVVVLAKGDVGLGNVDNTSDATKNAAVASLTNKDLTSGTNTFPTLNQSTTGSAATLTTARTIGTLTGDVTTAGSTFNGSANNTNATVVGKINGVALSGLATGILKNTTTTGVPSIAVAGTDYQAPITLTTTGTSGAATLLSNTLNIPQYSGGGGTGMTWSEVTGTSQTASVASGYITNNAGLVTVTLPGTAAVGDIVEVAGKGGRRLESRPGSVGFNTVRQYHYHSRYRRLLS
jgi:hypothetical protein